MKLTPWFSVGRDGPPVRAGWYEFDAPITFYPCNRETFMAYYHPATQTFHREKDKSGYAIAAFDKWRGVLK